MKLLALLLTAFGISGAWAAISDGTSSGQAINVTIVNIEDGDGYVILTFSGDLTKGPACAANHKNALVIGNGNNSPDAQRARRAFQLGQALKVSGGGNCKRVGGYETLSAIELMN